MIPEMSPVIIRTRNEELDVAIANKKNELLTLINVTKLSSFSGSGHTNRDRKNLDNNNNKMKCTTLVLSLKSKL